MMAFTPQSLRGQFLVLAMGAFALIAVLGVIGVRGTATMLRIANEQTTAALAVRANTLVALHYEAFQAAVYRALYTSQEDPGGRDAALVGMATLTSSIAAKLTELRGLTLTPELHRLLDELDAPAATYAALAIETVDLAFGNRAKAVAGLPELSAAYTTLRSTLEATSDNLEYWSIAKSVEANALNRAAHQVMIAALAIVAFSALAVYLYCQWTIARPVAAIAAVLRRLGQGDLDVDIKTTARRDEIGEITSAVALFRAHAAERVRLEAEKSALEVARIKRQTLIDAIVARFRTVMDERLTRVSERSAALERVATQLIGVAETTASKASSASGATKEAARSVRAMTLAADEMTSSIADINRQIIDISEAVAEAADAAADTDRRVGDLSGSARQISDIVTMIQAIAEQTNLLALNATIEAARAGESGRGFAVVAAEVKALAGQTRQATEAIARQVAAMQSAADTSAEAIRAIAETVAAINHRTSSIAATTGQQAAATVEINESAVEAARGTDIVAANVDGVAQAIAETNDSADSMRKASSDVAGETGALKAEINRFLADVAAA